MSTAQSILRTLCGSSSHAMAGSLAFLFDQDDQKPRDEEWEKVYQKGKKDAAEDPRYIRLREILRAVIITDEPVALDPAHVRWTKNVLDMLKISGWWGIPANGARVCKTGEKTVKIEGPQDKLTMQTVQHCVIAGYTVESITTK